MWGGCSPLRCLQHFLGEDLQTHEVNRLNRFYPLALPCFPLFPPHLLRKRWHVFYEKIYFFSDPLPFYHVTISNRTVSALFLLFSVEGSPLFSVLSPKVDQCSPAIAGLYSGPVGWRLKAVPDEP